MNKKLKYVKKNRIRNLSVLFKLFYARSYAKNFNEAYFKYFIDNFLFL